MFENRVLRKILQPKSEEEKGGCRKLHYTELIIVFLSKYYSGDQIKEDGMSGARGTYGGDEKMHTGCW